MTYKDLHDRNAVLKAIAECDRMGNEQFRKRYGYGAARSYFLIFDGKYYDSKAIVGAACSHQSGKLIKRTELGSFSAGKDRVVPKLKELGFEVVALELNEQNAAMPEEVSDSHWEGARRSVCVNSFERSPKARAACIEQHGSKCAICCLDFAEEYGTEFQGFIHVHHLVPLAEIDERYKVDPQKDLLPVCPNCHAVLHFGRKTRTPEEVRELRRNAQKSRRMGQAK